MSFAARFMLFMRKLCWATCIKGKLTLHPYENFWRENAALSYIRFTLVFRTQRGEPSKWTLFGFARERSQALIHIPAYFASALDILRARSMILKGVTLGATSSSAPTPSSREMSPPTHLLLATRPVSAARFPILNSNNQKLRIHNTKSPYSLFPPQGQPRPAPPLLQLSLCPL